MISNFLLHKLGKYDEKWVHLDNSGYAALKSIINGSRINSDKKHLFKVKRQLNGIPLNFLMEIKYDFLTCHILITASIFGIPFKFTQKHFIKDVSRIFGLTIPILCSPYKENHYRLIKDIELYINYGPRNIEYFISGPNIEYSLFKPASIHTIHRILKTDEKLLINPNTYEGLSLFHHDTNSIIKVVKAQGSFGNIGARFPKLNPNYNRQNAGL